MATFPEWSESADLGELTLDVDNRNQPKLVILLRGRFEIVRMIPYGPSEDLEEMLVRAVAPTEAGAIRSLITGLAAKLTLPKTGRAA